MMNLLTGQAASKSSLKEGIDLRGREGRAQSTGWKSSPGFQKAQVAIFFLTVCVLLAWGSPPLALVFGMLLALTLGSPIPKAGHKIGKWLLQGCVILLGFEMNLNTILRAGAHGALFAAVTICTTLLLGFWVGRWMGINRNTSALISAGTAICGGSAIAAVSSVLVVTEGEIAVAMGTVFLLNAVALYLFPVIGHILHLSQSQFGVWAGVAIHDISSVVGASLSYGPKSLEVATAVKLSRTLWIIPVTLGIQLAYNYGISRRAACEKGGAVAKPRKIKATVPWFVGLFLLASLMRSFMPAIASFESVISHVARIGLTIVLLLIGTSLSPQALRTVGWKAGLQGAILWVFISAASLFVILHYNMGN